MNRVNIKLSPNKSKTYLLPLLSDSYYLPESIMKNFINCYIYDEDNLHDNCIYLLFNYDIKNPAFTKFEYELSQTPGFEKHYDLDNNQILFVLRFPREFLAEYYHFINGKYSLYQKEAVDMIVKYLIYNKANINFINKIKQIFNKDPKLKLQLEAEIGMKLDSNAELGGIADIEKETINIKKYISTYI